MKLILPEHDITYEETSSSHIYAHLYEDEKTIGMIFTIASDTFSALMIANYVMPEGSKIMKSVPLSDLLQQLSDLTQIQILDELAQ